MKTITFSLFEWRKLALKFKPKLNFDSIMYDTYGLKRIGIIDHTYQIVDAQKYIIFLLTE